MRGLAYILDYMGQSATREPRISLYQCLNLVSFITAHVTHGWAGLDQGSLSSTPTREDARRSSTTFTCVKKQTTSVTDQEHSSADFSHTDFPRLSVPSITDKSVLLNGLTLL